MALTLRDIPLLTRVMAGAKRGTTRKWTKRKKTTKKSKTPHLIKVSGMLAENAYLAPVKAPKGYVLVLPFGVEDTVFAMFKEKNLQGIVNWIVKRWIAKGAPNIQPGTQPLIMKGAGAELNMTATVRAAVATRLTTGTVTG